jgi:hypothetical protein
VVSLCNIDGANKLPDSSHAIFDKNWHNRSRVGYLV